MADASPNMPGLDSARLETVRSYLESLDKTELEAVHLHIQALVNKPTSTNVTIKGDVGPASALAGGRVEVRNNATRDVNEIRVQGATIEQLIVGGEGAPFKEREKEVNAEETYLRWLFRTARRVSLGGISPGEADATQRPLDVTLDAVYVALNTYPSDKVRPGKQPEDVVGGNSKPPTIQSALEAVQHNRTMVLLGDPGSGKTTFVNYLTLCLSGARLEPKGSWLERLNSPNRSGDNRAWQHGPLLPVRVILRDFAASLPPDAKTASAQNLWEYMTSELCKHGLEDCAPHLHKAIRRGECIVMLDGLDEVLDSKRRSLVRQAVVDFAESQAHTRNRFVVTCRVLSYSEPEWQLPGFPTARLAPLDDDQIAAFIGAWYATLARQGRLASEVAEAKASELRDASAYLRDLAQNPMLLTVMATIHTYEGELPYERARLYERAVELLMWRWQHAKFVPGSGREPGIEQQLGVRAERLFNALCEVAWKAHGEQGEREGAADLPAKEVLDVLQGYVGKDWGKAQTFCRYVEERAGLLVSRGLREGRKCTSENEIVYAFPHRTFQEYLAGCFLSGQREFSRMVLEDLVPKGEVWREVVLLAAGHQVFNQKNVTSPLDVVNVLCPEQIPTDKNGWRAVWWAGEVLSIVGVEAAERDAVGKRVLPRVREHLVALLEGDHLPPRQRVQAADALGRLGDPREGVCTLEPALARIPGGAFKMGDGDVQREVSLAPFRMARYEVTNAQFCQFIDGGGYENPRYWSEAGWAWRQRAGDDLAGFVNDLRWGIVNRPVVGVNWFEAMAYAAWLSEQTGKPYRLPGEAEWERAAAGTDGRRYPWGEEWKDGIANTEEAGIGVSSAVGAFPHDTTPEGVLDMGGNTWEWTLSREGAYPFEPNADRDDPEGTDERVLRGGSCANSRRLSRCTYRNWLPPDSRVTFIGFRIVLSDAPPALPAPSTSSK